MGTRSRLLVTMAIVVAASTAAAAQSLKPEWTRPVGGSKRLVGVEEYGRCSVFVDSGAVQIVTPSGAVSWSWRFSSISKYLNPREVAVSHACDAIAIVGDASYKYVWIVDKAGTSASIKFAVTPGDVEFDRTGKLIAVGTYGGAMFLYSHTGALQWQRNTKAAGVLDLAFSDDNQRILFKGWLGVGVVSAAGQVEWTLPGTFMSASSDLTTLSVGVEPHHGPGGSLYFVADAQRRQLWSSEGSPHALVSAIGDRVLGNRGAITLSSRTGAAIRRFDDYRSAIALSEDGTRAWLRGQESLDCVDDRGNVLVRIDGEFSNRAVTVSRDFAQVFVIREKELHPVAVERYDVPAPCKLS